MFMILVTRVVKSNTGATAQYQPRTANVETKRFIGPFKSLRGAERALQSIVGTHTCLDATIWTEEQIRAEKPHQVTNLNRLADSLREAHQILDAIHASPCGN